MNRLIIGAMCLIGVSACTDDISSDAYSNQGQKTLSTWIRIEDATGANLLSDLLPAESLPAWEIFSPDTLQWLTIEVERLSDHSRMTLSESAWNQNDIETYEGGTLKGPSLFLSWLDMEAIQSHSCHTEYYIIHLNCKSLDPKQEHTIRWEIEVDNGRLYPQHWQIDGKETETQYGTSGGHYLPLARIVINKN